MKTTESETRRRRGRALPESSILRSSRYGLPWTFAAFTTFTLIGGAMAVGVWSHAYPVVAPGGAGQDRIVLTANAAPPALWSNAWLGRHSYQSVAFHGLRRFATGFHFVIPHKPRTLGQDLMRMGPALSERFVRFRDAVSAEAKQTLVARAWL